MSLRDRKSNKREIRQLTRETEGMLFSAQEIYWHELAKEPELRDKNLMEECLKTIDFSSNILYNSRVARGTRSFAMGLRRVTVALSAVVLLAGISVGVAYASGVNVWNIIFRSEPDGYVTIEGASGENAAPSFVFPNVETDGYVQFDDVAVALDTLDFVPPMLPCEQVGLVESEVWGAGSAASVELSVDYLGDNGEYLHYTVTAFPDTDSAFTYSADVGGYPQSSGVASDSEFNIVQNGSIYTVFWVEQSIVYQVQTNVSYDELVALLNGM